MPTISFRSSQCFSFAHCYYCWQNQKEEQRHCSLVNSLRLGQETVKIRSLNFSRLSLMDPNQGFARNILWPRSLVVRFVPASSTVGSRPPSIGGGPPSVGLALQGSMSRGSFLFSVSEALEESLEPRTFTLDPGTPKIVSILTPSKKVESFSRQ